MGTTLPALIGQLQALEQHYLPDFDTSLARLRVTPQNTVVVPDLGELLMTEWSAGQLSRILGYQPKWFKGISAADQAQETNKRLGMADRAMRLRVARPPDGHGRHGGVLRAIVGQTYTSIPDSVVATALLDALGSAEPELAVVRSAVTDRSTSFVVRLGDAFQVGGPGNVGEVAGTLTVRNSDVGYASLMACLSLLRLACKNGMLLPDPGAFLMRRRHLGLDRKTITSDLKERLHDLPARLHRGAHALEAASHLAVENVEQEIRAALREARIPLSTLPQVKAAYEQEPHASVWGVSQALARAAQGMTPEGGLATEMAAGTYVRRAVERAESNVTRGA